MDTTRVDSSREKYSHDCDSIVIKHCRDVFRRELVRGIANEKAGLANSTVTDDNASISPLIVVSTCLNNSAPGLRADTRAARHRV